MLYAKARQLIKEGAIGQLNMVEAWWDRNSAQGAWEYSIDPNASPENIDWDRFLGPAPKHAVRSGPPVPLAQLPATTGPGSRATFSSTCSRLSTTSPAARDQRSVFGTGGLRYWKDGRDVPDVVLGLYDYPEIERTAGIQFEAARQLRQWLGRNLRASASSAAKASSTSAAA